MGGTLLGNLFVASAGIHPNVSNQRTRNQDSVSRLSPFPSKLTLDFSGMFSGRTGSPCGCHARYTSLFTVIIGKDTRKRVGVGSGVGVGGGVEVGSCVGLGIAGFGVAVATSETTGMFDTDGKAREGVGLDVGVGADPQPTNSKARMATNIQFMARDLERAHLNCIVR